ncbi:MAG TPA: hypothetical protein VMW24_21405 [Sedimentisphaerales bacterium]|nr:hypothetical protein [Sedimentisphaerales bacterium]
MKIFIGTDIKDARAYDVLVESIYSHTKSPVEVIPIKEHELRWQKKYWRSYRVDSKGQMWDDRDGKPFSTAFSFTRFCVPMMNDFRDEWVVFMDPDMMFRADIEELFDYADKSKALSVVKHVHTPTEETKMGGLAQTLYERKNWSSLMIMNTARCNGLDPYTVNNMPGSYLHGLGWIEDEKIGSLHEAWNWLEGWSSPDITPLNVHFTRGTPDMPACEGVAYADEWLSYANQHHVRKVA